MNQLLSEKHITLAKCLLFMLCLLPFGQLLLASSSAKFAEDPAAFIQRWSGIWTFNLLLLSLGISPLRALTQCHWLTRLRRLLDLFTFFYATLHFVALIGIEHDFVANEIAKDILKRPFIVAGFAAFMILLPLAATSNQFSVRYLGGRKWQALHRSIYLAGILAAVHYLWQTKIEAWYWPLTYSIVLGLLLYWRVQERRRKSIVVPKAQPDRPLRFFNKKPD